MVSKANFFSAICLHILFIRLMANITLAVSELPPRYLRTHSHSDLVVMIVDINAEGISELHAGSLGTNQSIRISSLLSLFLDVGIYQMATTESRWFYDGEGCKAAQLGYR